MSDWQVGDLAVFVGGSDCGGLHSARNRVGKGMRYRRVIGIRPGPFISCKAAYALVLEGHPSGTRGTCPFTWRKVSPDEREACEPEFVTLLRRIKRKQQVTVGCHNHTATITFTPGPATQWLLGIADELKQSKGRECGNER